MAKKEFYFNSSNHINKIHTVVWKPEGEIRGIVQLSHGMTEYVNRYSELAKYLNRKGLLVAGNDHMGHGKSVENEQGWGYFTKKNPSKKTVEDMYHLTRILKKHYPNKPYILLGHSMGSFMARRYAMTYGKGLNGLILVGTGNQARGSVLFGLGLVRLIGIFLGEKYRSKKVYKIVFGAYQKGCSSARTEYDWLSRNEGNVDRYRKDPACTFLFTLNGYRALFSTINYIEKKKNIKKIPVNLPVLFVSGEEDPVGNYSKAVKEAYRIYKDSGIKDVEIKLYPKDRHEVLNEVDRYEVYKNIGDWIKDRIFPD